MPFNSSVNTIKYRARCLIDDTWYCRGRVLSGRILYIASKILHLLKIAKLARYCCETSLRFKYNPNAVLLYKRLIKELPYTSSDVTYGVSLADASSDSILIKWPEKIENNIIKGIIVVTYTGTISYFARNIDMETMGKYFHFVFEPSSAGYADPDIFWFYAKGNTIFVQASEINDIKLLNSFRETFVPVSFGASDWVDMGIFKPSPVQKKYDSVYIANTHPGKRVIRYLDAVKNIVEKGYSDYVGCLVCASWGNAKDLVSEVVKQYSLEKNLVVKFSLCREDVVKVLNESKLNILLSYKEGSNRSLFEAIFCDIPVICISENIGVNKSYINEYTGLLVPDAELEYSLLWLKDNLKKFTPRAWAVKNISPKVTTQKLLDIIAANNGNQKATGTYSCFVKTNNPEVTYFDYPSINHSLYLQKVLSLFCLNQKQAPSQIEAHLLEIREEFIKQVN